MLTYVYENIHVKLRMREFLYIWLFDDTSDRKLTIKYDATAQSS